MTKPQVPMRAVELMREQFEVVQRGDYARALLYQDEINSVLSDAGLPTYVLPEEYFRLLHEITITGDSQQMEQIGARMNDLMREAGMEFPSEQDFPEECLALERASRAAAESGDGKSSNQYYRQFCQCMTRHGFDSFAIPDEYFDLQAEAHDAFEKQDWPRFQELTDKCQEIMESQGIFNIGNIIR